MAFGITTFAESPFASTGSQSISVAVTGQQLTIAETSPGVVIDVTVPLTGQAITGSTGTLAPADVMGLTGVSATASVGTVDPADQVMGLTGQSATVSVGAVDVIAYANIDTGSNTSYSDISTGSNTSYSDVATGSNTSYNDVTGEAA